MVSEKIFFNVFPIISLWQIMTPLGVVIWSPGAWLAGFIKGITKHCYIKNIKDLGLMVSEMKFLCSSYYKSM